MNKGLSLSVSVEEISYPGQRVLEVLVPRDALGEWCLGLCLLREGLVTTVTITFGCDRSRLVLSVLREENLAHGLFVETNQRVARLSVGTKSLEYIQHFFLKYFRDGIAEVDHIDLEGRADADGTGASVDVILKVQDARTALTPQEAEEWLGE